ncbi:DUF4294 domain-containing protein [Pedobacter changchengzhani]|uniref:DUF4294 domain-containing protein n=1 Tax=Pedobacter changchengzhani TaxID=2529274 RepID=A0A4R5MMT1_9SPHI|nr:DUF4294 domain-containing protein [Pedobacter changchengzhani]TDG36595.1 DUF4294 domain-containing protein [Pedobacter changchengzhani]
MKIKVFFMLCIVMIFSISLKAQGFTPPVFPKKGLSDTIRVGATNDNGVMIPWMQLQDVSVVAERIFKTPEAKLAFNRLRYNVLKVMPYALFAKRRYEQLEEDLQKVSEKKQQKELVKTCDREIKDMFNREIKDLTITQGQILTKLIDREVGKTTYDLVKQTKGGFTAFSYQLIARVVGHNLKSTYDPVEDRDIESIIRSSGFYQ